MLGGFIGGLFSLRNDGEETRNGPPLLYRFPKVPRGGGELGILGPFVRET